MEKTAEEWAKELAEMRAELDAINARHAQELAIEREKGRLEERSKAFLDGLFSFVTPQILDVPNISPIARLLLGYLVSYFNTNIGSRDDCVVLTNGFLARRFHVTESTVSLTLKDLSRKNLIATVGEGKSRTIEVVDLSRFLMKKNGKLKITTSEHHSSSTSKKSNDSSVTHSLDREKYNSVSQTLLNEALFDSTLNISKDILLKNERHPCENHKVDSKDTIYINLENKRIKETRSRAPKNSSRNFGSDGFGKTLKAQEYAKRWFEGLPPILQSQGVERAITNYCLRQRLSATDQDELSLAQDLGVSAKAKFAHVLEASLGKCFRYRTVFIPFEFKDKVSDFVIEFGNFLSSKREAGVYSPEIDGKDPLKMAGFYASFCTTTRKSLLNLE
jgi:hypothetical protein